MSDILDQDGEKILLEKLRLENKLLRRVISVIMLFIIIVELFYIWGE